MPEYFFGESGNNVIFSRLNIGVKVYSGNITGPMYSTLKELASF